MLSCLKPRMGQRCQSRRDANVGNCRRAFDACAPTEKSAGQMGRKRRRVDGASRSQTVMRYKKGSWSRPLYRGCRLIYAQKRSQKAAQAQVNQVKQRCHQRANCKGLVLTGSVCSRLLGLGLQTLKYSVVVFAKHRLVLACNLPGKRGARHSSLAGDYQRGHRPTNQRCLWFLHGLLHSPNIRVD